MAGTKGKLAGLGKALSLAPPNAFTLAGKLSLAICVCAGSQNTKLIITAKTVLGI